jgi:CRISPR-associated endonuclease Cas1 subtype II
MITKHCKLSYKNGYLIVRDHEIKMIHLSEIHTVMIDSIMVSITSYLICELMKQKIKIIFCDEKRNPICESLPYYGRHNSSKTIQQQILWNERIQQEVWTAVIKQKIDNQALLLYKLHKDEYQQIQQFSNELELYDVTNREGHAAKVYFNALFSKLFTREEENDINIALNYGYAILLSTFNKEIVANGYLTQLGMKHCNEYNSFNLSSDLMEPFRILVDELVYEKKNDVFTGGYKEQLVDILNKKVKLGNQEYYVTNAISVYVKSIFKAMEKQDIQYMKLFIFI